LVSECNPALSLASGEEFHLAQARDEEGLNDLEYLLGLAAGGWEGC
jgi:hypothetical protein